jgi:hypothetical protein
MDATIVQSKSFDIDTVDQISTCSIFIKRSLGQLLGGNFLLLESALIAFAIAVCEKAEVRSHQDSVLDKLLHAVDNSISVRRRHESASTFSAEQGVELVTFWIVGVGELGVCLWYRGLVWYGEEAHPSP